MPRRCPRRSFRRLKKQYGLGFSSGILAAAANLGPIIPPSGAMIVYAFMAGSSVSVGGLFMAGVVPGLILFVALMGLCCFIAWKRDYPIAGTVFSVSRLFRYPPAQTFGFADVLLTAANTSALAGAMIAFVSTVARLFTIDMLPLQLASMMKGLTDSPFMFLCLISVMLLVVGLFLGSNAAYIMLVPLFHPIALEYGIDPLHFGFIFVLNLVIGMLTPPVGVVLFVATGITGVKMGELVRESWPFIAAMYAVLFLCMLVPSVVTWLPTRLGY